MAIAPTGDVYKSLTFDGKTSRSYGVYITGEAVYNAPEREVEMISIPGRNGAFALDKGRFENVTVTYPAGIFADNETDFAAAISDFRNYLCSRKGYCRLTDEYNPNEYRMAVYKSGLEVDPAQLRAGEFEITFECKPQRWLTSGETPVTIANSGDTITNPTLFESGPLLEVEGYGAIGFNGFNIQLNNGAIGDVALWDEYTDERNLYSAFSKAVSIPLGLLNANDTITIDGFWIRGHKLVTMSGASTRPVVTITSSSHTGVSDATLEPFEEVEQNGDAYYVRMGYSIAFPLVQLEYGVPLSLVDAESVYFTVVKGSSTSDYEIHYETSLVYDGDRTVTFALQYAGASGQNFTRRKYVIPAGIGHSTKNMLGNPTIIDCDLGEAYKIEDGAVVSLNQYIDLGSKLPTLSPGSNEITYDNTITDFKVVPNWWKV